MICSNDLFNLLCSVVVLNPMPKDTQLIHTRAWLEPIPKGEQFPWHTQWP